jgi:PAS domain S-box-containing protein
MSDDTTGLSREHDALREENARLRAALSEAEEALRAIREGEVDAIVVAGKHGEQVFSLSGAESIYRLIVQTMQEAALTVTPDGTILSCNPQFEALIRFTAGWVIGRPLEGFVVPEERVALAALLARSQVEPVRQRLVFRATDGTPTPTHVSAQAICQPEGLSLCLVATDLTQLETSLETLQRLRDQQEALRASAEEFRAFFDTPAVGVAHLDLAGRFLRVNDRYCQLTGFAREELLARTPADLAPPEERDAAQAELTAYLAGGAPVFEVEKRYIRKDGRGIWVQVTAAPIRDGEGRMIRSAGVVRDVTLRKQAEDALRQAHDTLEQRVQERTAALEQTNTALRLREAELTEAQRVAGVGSWHWAVPTATVTWSAETARIFGRDPQGPAPTYLDHLRCYTPVSAAQLREAVAQALETGTPYELDLEVVRPDGTRRWIAARGEAIRSEGGRIDALRGTVLDITRRKEAEAALQQAHAALATRATELAEAVRTLERQADQLRMMAAELAVAEQRERQRLAAVLHDGLQQILVGGRLRVTLLARHPDPAVTAACSDLGRFLDEALASSRALTAELNPPVLQEGLTAGLTWLARWMADTHHLSVEVQVADSFPLDEPTTLLLFQSVRELLFNTVKHAQVDRARVEVSRRPGAVQIVVADAGVGFEPDRIQPVGIGGLGIPSIRQRLEFLGGSLTVSSAPGQGSRFVLSVPVPDTGPNA